MFRSTNPNLIALFLQTQAGQPFANVPQQQLASTPGFADALDEWTRHDFSYSWMDQAVFLGSQAVLAQFPGGLPNPVTPAVVQGVVPTIMTTLLAWNNPGGFATTPHANLTIEDEAAVQETVAALFGPGWSVNIDVGLTGTGRQFQVIQPEAPGQAPPPRTKPPRSLGAVLQTEILHAEKHEDDGRLLVGPGSKFYEDLDAAGKATMDTLLTSSNVNSLGGIEVGSKEAYIDLLEAWVDLAEAIANGADTGELQAAFDDRVRSF